MKVFFDCEFTGLHQKTTLISIGCVSENGDEFYAEFDDYDETQVTPWIQENVIEKLQWHAPQGQMLHFSREKGLSTGIIDVGTRGSLGKIRIHLHDWLQDIMIANSPGIEFWSDCLAYDWVLFCEIFGGAMDVPDYIYYIPFDICTVFKLKDVDPDINREFFAFGDVAIASAMHIKLLGEKHNALWDAKVIQACYEKLMQM